MTRILTDQELQEWLDKPVCQGLERDAIQTAIHERQQRIEAEALVEALTTVVTEIGSDVLGERKDYHFRRRKAWMKSVLSLTGTQALARKLEREG